MDFINLSKFKSADSDLGWDFSPQVSPWHVWPNCDESTHNGQHSWLPLSSPSDLTPGTLSPDGSHACEHTPACPCGAGLYTRHPGCPWALAETWSHPAVLRTRLWRPPCTRQVLHTHLVNLLNEWTWANDPSSLKFLSVSRKHAPSRRRWWEMTRSLLWDSSPVPDWESTSAPGSFFLPPRYQYTCTECREDTQNTIRSLTSRSWKSQWKAIGRQGKKTKAP